MRLLITGGRNWDDLITMWSFLDDLHREMKIDVLIHGDARGADRMAGEWAETRGVPVEKYPAQWNKYGRAAGVIRNQQMLDEGNLDHVAVFHKNLSESKGTKDMVNRCSKLNLPTFFIPGPPNTTIEED